MNQLRETHLHTVKNAKALESKLRRLLQSPEKITGKYIQSEMTILDLGYGTGYFTIEIAGLLTNKGKVIAVDIQEGMLEILRNKLNKIPYGIKYTSIKVRKTVWE